MSINTVPASRVTPEKIERLGEREIFVFGSSLMGVHFGDAARVAYDKFGAGGVSEGLKGSTYAIPVVRAGIDMVKPHIEAFLSFARSHTEYRFFVTRIGCGIAGFTDEDIAPLFAVAVGMEHVTLPASFWEVLQRKGLYVPHIPPDRIAADHIETLEENEIFVFGSNLSGRHYGGAAFIANKRFGAEWGIGRGLTGKTYAIPTMRASVEMIKPYVDEFISFARTHTEYRFLVTRIGCGIAGFTDRDIAPLFCDAVDVPNIALPLFFWHVIFSLG